MKKILIALIALCVALLFACTPSVDVNDPKTVAVWGDQPQASGTPVAVYLKALTDAFKAANPEETVAWVTQKETGIALLDKMKAAVEENKSPDVVQSQGGILMEPYAQTERILDLTAELGDINTCAAVKDVMRWDGKIYGVAPFYSVAGLFVNETKFNELGLKIPTTVAEMEKAAEALKAKGIQPIAADGADTRSISYLFMYLVNRIGGDAIRQSLHRTLRFDAPVYVQAGEKLKEWAQKGYFGQLPLAGNASDLMTSGQAGMQVTGSWMCAAYADPQNTGGTIGFYPFPVIAGGKGAMTDILGMSDVAFIGAVKPEIKRDLVNKFMHTAVSPEALKGGSGMISSDPDYPPTERLLGMAAQALYKAVNLQFFWEKELPAATGAGIASTAVNCLAADADVMALFTRLEQTAQSEMGGVVDM